jgi:archaellum component FlaC
VPLLANKVAEVLHGAEALRTAAQELLDEVDSERDEAATELTALRDALPQIATQIEADEKRLEEAGTTVTEAWQEATPEHEEQVASRVDEVIDEVHKLHEILAEAGAKVGQSQTVGEAALARLRHDAEEANERLHQALQAMQEEVNSFHSSAEAAKQRLTTAAQALLTRLLAISSEAQSGAQEAMGAFHAKGSAYRDGAQAFLSRLSQQLMDKVDGAGEQVEHDLTTPVVEAAGILGSELDRLAAAASKGEDTLAKHEQDLGAALGRAKGEMEPMRAAIGQIQEAARKLGVEQSVANP